MRWRGRRQSSNVEDRRGQGGTPGGMGRPSRQIPLPIGRGAGGSGLSGILHLLVVVVALLSHDLDPFQLLEV